MMVWSLFIIGLMGLFFYNKIDSIIPMVVLPTTEIIEPKKPCFLSLKLGDKVFLFRASF